MDFMELSDIELGKYISGIWESFGNIQLAEFGLVILMVLVVAVCSGVTLYILSHNSGMYTCTLCTCCTSPTHDDKGFLKASLVQFGLRQATACPIEV